MAAGYAFVDLYSTRIPVAGWGSAALLAIAAAIVLALPEAQALTLCGLAGGVAIGVFRIVRRAQRLSRGEDTGGVVHLSS